MITPQDMRVNDAVILGIAGGSGAGKSTISQIIESELGALKVERICLDSFFLPFNKMPTYYSDYLGKEQPNFNRPDSIDFEGMIEFCQEAQTVFNLIILDGHLTLHHEEMRNLMHIKCFVTVDIEEMLERRTTRNLDANYGGSKHDILHYNKECVLPMYYQYILPTKKYADIRIPNSSKEHLERDVVIKQLCRDILINYGSGRSSTCAS